MTVTEPEFEVRLVDRWVTDPYGIIEPKHVTEVIVSRGGWDCSEMVDKGHPDHDALVAGSIEYCKDRIRNEAPD